ncbi:MAG: hypothetical protein FWD33_00845 [Alphaproteobacteria bacterium]|nr:hypothetical protein [Alphaproteobacteria bacterium]
MKFDTFFFDSIPLKWNRKTREIDKSVFWKQAETKQGFQGISEAKGCYIFGLSCAGGLMPYYVGQAKKTFKQEVFGLHQMRIYDKCINNNKGTPVLILVSAMTGKNEFSKANHDKVINWVEDLLISYALERNPKVENSSKTAYWKNVEIPGLWKTGWGKNTKDSNALKRMFFGQQRKKSACK